MPLFQNDLYNAAQQRRNTVFSGGGTPEIPASGDPAGAVPGAASAPMASTQGLGGGGGAGGAVGSLRMGEDLGPFGVNPQALGGAVSRWASWAPAAPKSVASAIQAAKIPQLSRNPQLPQHPLGAYTDSQYEADNAVLEQQINAAYQDVLSQTGYDSPQGHIAGDVELNAARQERDQLTGMMNAVNQVTGQMQQAGTIFSGYHGTERARAEQPYITALGDLAIDTPKTLTRLYQQGEDLMRQYAVGQNQLLMQAAQRRAAALAAAAAAAGTGTTAPTAPEAPTEPVVGPQLSGGTGSVPDQGYTYPDPSIFEPGGAAYHPPTRAPLPTNYYGGRTQYGRYGYYG